MKGTELMEEALIGQYGERCPDFDKDCIVCRAWQELDNLTDMFAAVATLTAQHNSRVCEVNGRKEVTAVVFPSDLHNALALVDPEWYSREYKKDGAMKTQDEIKWDALNKPKDVDEEWDWDDDDDFSGKVVDQIVKGRDVDGYPFMEVRFGDGSCIRITGEGHSVSDVIATWVCE